MNANAEIDVCAALRRQNEGRDRERLAMKYAKMRSDPFIFLRGACPLFYAALPDHPALRDAPTAWCCGDMHFENFGSYKADNRLVYFDINDFDEAALAPCSWDIIRLLTSLHCGAAALNATAEEARETSRECLAGYRAGLARGKALWVEGETAGGLIRDLFATLQQRVRGEYLDRRTVKKGSHRHIKVDGVKALAATREEQEKVTQFVERFAAGQRRPDFFKVLDVARRIAGTGSLGVMRYIILVEGKGSPDANYLLDLKEAKPSGLVAHAARLGITQPNWRNEAERVVTLQKRLQAVDHAFLYAAELDGVPSILKGLQASEDRVAIGEWGKKPERLREVAATMGKILAWDQLRAAGRQGAASPDELIAFGQRDDWLPALLELTDKMVEITRRQWQAFCAVEPGSAALPL